MRLPTTLILPSLCVGILLLSGCSRGTELSGQVFVTVNDGSSIKLGGVEVLAASGEALERAFQELAPKVESEKPVLREAVKRAEAALTIAREQSKQAEARRDKAMKTFNTNAFIASLDDVRAASDATQAAEAAMKKAVGGLAAWPSAEFFFQALPMPSARTMTNADGEFNLVVPTRSRFAVAAHAERNIGDTKEHFYWLVWVTPGEVTRQPFLLTNRNLATAGAPESVVKAGGPVMP
jgi:hypothetical protein